MLPNVSPISLRGLRRMFLALIMAGMVSLAPWQAVAAPLRDEDPLEGNSKLDQVVEVSAEGVPVGDLLKLLSGKTGTNLSADAYVTDDKVIVFGPARPLKALMSDLAGLFNDKWHHYVNVEGKEKYVLIRERRAREYEDGLANSLGSRMLVHMEALVSALKQTPEELTKRPENDPVRIALSDPDNRFTLQLYAQLSDEQRLALFQQGNIGLPFSGLPPELQNTGAASHVHWLERFVEEHKRTSDVAIDPDIINNRLAELKTQHIAFQVTQRFGSTTVNAIPFGTVATFKDAWQWALPAHGNPYTRKPVVKGATLPNEKSIDQAAKEPALPDRLRRLAEGAHIPIVADYYRSKPVTRPLGDQALPGTEGPKASHEMDRLFSEDGFAWWVQGTTLFVRKRDWYNQRQYEPADSWLLALNYRLKSQHGALTFNDVFSLTSLTPRQIVGVAGLKFRDAPANSRSLGELDDSTAAGLHELLLFTASIWPSPNKPLSPGNGVPANIEEHGSDLVTVDPASLGVDQRNLLGSFLTKQPGAIDPNDSSLFYLHVYPRSDVSESADTPEGAQWKSVSIQINTVEGTKKQRAETAPIAHAYDGYMALFFLPAELPDARKNKTRVELVIPH